MFQDLSNMLQRLANLKIKVNANLNYFTLHEIILTKHKASFFMNIDVKMVKLYVIKLNLECMLIDVIFIVITVQLYLN